MGPNSIFIFVVADNIMWKVRLCFGQRARNFLNPVLHVFGRRRSVDAQTTLLKAGFCNWLAQKNINRDTHIKRFVRRNFHDLALTFNFCM